MNGYINETRAKALLIKGWIYRQNIEQTEFKLVKGMYCWKLDKKTAYKVKMLSLQLKKQTKLL